MKKLFTCVFFIAISWRPVVAQTSVYHPFPDSNAVWNFVSHQWCGLGFDNWEIDYSITITGDTLIGSNTYHKLNIPVEVVISNGGCSVTGTWVTAGHYAGAFRQENLNRKVFFVLPTDTVEQLLYDFNLQVGDTVTGFLTAWTGMPEVVQSIDSVFVGNGYRKRWLIDPCYQVFFIEGIGSTYGLIERLPGCITDGSDFSLTCFLQNGQTLYPDSTTSCDVISEIKNVLHKNGSVLVAPNPFHSTTILLIDSKPVIQNAELKLFNLFGKVVQQFIITGNSIVINRKNLEDGIYLCRILNNGQQIASGKLVVD